MITNKWQADACEDANGFFTIRLKDDTVHGNTDEQPIATVYTKDHAALIAASPELLAACKAMITDFDLGESCIKTSKKMMEQAIDKAEPA